MDNINTTSDRMVETQAAGNIHSLRNPSCVLPDAIVQQFLLDVIEQTAFPGKITEQVSAVKHLLRNAQIAG